MAGENETGQNPEDQKSEKFKWKIGDDSWLDLPKNIEGVDLENILKSTANKGQKKLDSAEAGFKKKLSELQETLNSKELTLAQKEEKIQEFELANMDTEERAKILADKDIKEMQEKLETAIKEKNVFQSLHESEKTTNEIYNAISNHPVVNVPQAMTLLKSFGKVVLVKNEDNGGYSTKVEIMVDGETKTMTPKDAADIFFAMSENANLLKANIKPGGGTSQVGAAINQDGRLIYKRSDLNRDSKIAAEYREKMMSGELVSIVEG